MLLKSKALISTQKDHGFTALMCASYYGKIEAVKELLYANARTDIRTFDNQTAITIAKDKGHTLILRLLENWPQELAFLNGLHSRLGAKSSIKRNFLPKGPGENLGDRNVIRELFTYL